MDRKEEKSITKVFDKISSKELLGADVIDNKPIYSVIGFMPACDFVDSGLLISNLGYLLAQKGLNTCIVDLKVFYPNIYQFLNIKPQKKSSGLIKALKSDRVDLRDEIQSTDYKNLYLLSPSPQDLIEEYYDFEFENLERLINILKYMFDIVLLDIPNNPPLELCLGAMKYCHVGFFVAAERVDVASNMIKLLDHASSVGISTAKFTSVVFMNVQDIDFDYTSVKDLGFNVVAALPLVNLSNKLALDGKLYVKDNPFINKFFKREINRLVDLLLG